MKKLDNFKRIISDPHKNNIESFCDYGQLLITKLSDAGGEDTQVFDKVYEALTNSRCPEFNNQLVVWWSIQDQTGTTLDVGELLDKAKTKYRGMVHLGTWKKKSSDDTAIPKKSEHHKDIAVLITNAKSQDKKIRSLTTSIEKNKVKNEQSFLSL